MKCTKCFGLGLPSGCPKCGIDSNLKTISLDSTDESNLPLQIQLTELVPDAYKGRYWSPNTDSPNIKFKKVQDIMLRVYQLCSSGRIPGFSLFISGSQKLEKELFVYSCMQQLLIHNFSVVPFMSTLELRRVMRVTQYNPKYKFLDKWTYDKIISSDVLFLTVTHLSEDRHTDISLLQEVLDTRSRLNKPTIIVSDYSLESMVSYYGSKEYLLIFNTDSTRDTLRYPFIVQSGEE